MISTGAVYLEEIHHYKFQGNQIPSLMQLIVGNIISPSNGQVFQSASVISPVGTIQILVSM